MDPFGAISSELISEAVSLEHLGLHEIAWKRQDVVRVINELLGSRTVILGGDVYRSNARGQLEPTYDSWTSDREPDDTLQAYARKSHESALAYVGKYPRTADERWFVLVLSSDETAGI